MQQAQELNAVCGAQCRAEPGETGVDCRADSRTYREDRPAKYKTAILGGAKTFDGTEADRGYVVNEQTGEMIPMGMIGAMSQTTNKKFRQQASAK